MKHATATSKRQNYTNWMEEDRDLREMQGQTELDAGGGGGGTESDWTTANWGRSGGRRRVRVWDILLRVEIGIFGYDLWTIVFLNGLGLFCYSLFFKDNYLTHSTFCLVQLQISLYPFFTLFLLSLPNLLGSRTPPPQLRTAPDTPPAPIHHHHMQFCEPWTLTLQTQHCTPPP